jgi:hypothetical protein
MFAEQLNTAIAAASLNTLDHLARTLWQGHAAGAIADDQAQLLAEMIERWRAVSPRANLPSCGSLPTRCAIMVNASCRWTRLPLELVFAAAWRRTRSVRLHARAC